MDLSNSARFVSRKAVYLKKDEKLPQLLTHRTDNGRPQISELPALEDSNGMIVHPKFGISKMLQNSSQNFHREDLFHNTRNSVDYSLSKPNNLGLKNDYNGAGIGQSIDTLKN